MDLLDQFDRSTQWRVEDCRRRDKLDDTTPCEAWDVRTLINHMIDTQHLFTAKARGEDAPFPTATPPALIGDDPVGPTKRPGRGRSAAHRGPGVLDKTGPMSGVASATSSSTGGISRPRRARTRPCPKGRGHVRRSTGGSRTNNVAIRSRPRSTSQTTPRCRTGSYAYTGRQP